MKIIADENIPFVRDCFCSIGDVLLSPGRKINAQLLKDADVLLVRSITKVNAGLLALTDLKFVATATIGTEHIDHAYLEDRGIGFASAPGSNSNSVAEYIVAALLSLGRKGKFTLEGKSIGIVGVGNVGAKVAQKTAALGMNPCLNDPPLQRQTRDPKYLPLEELYNCDFITLHTPLTFEGVDKTFHLADRSFFDSLKAGTTFINTARGGVTDTEALKHAIKSKRIAATVLDVWENEPNIDNELLRILDLSTPHIAGYSFDGKVAGMIMIYRAVCEHFGIEPKFNADDFLPPPDVPEIRIETTTDTEENILHQTVQQVYTVNRDDFNTREILMVPAEQRGKWFDDLRKNYPVRREFRNTNIIFENPSQTLAAKLAGIGFKV